MSATLLSAARQCFDSFVFKSDGGARRGATFLHGTVLADKDKQNKFGATTFQNINKTAIVCVNLLRTAWLAIWPFEDTAFDFGDRHHSL